MSLLKKVVLAGFISTAMLATAPSVMAKPAGKQENQTSEGVARALDSAVAAAEATLQGLKDGVDMETGLALFKHTKQESKTIESAVVKPARAKAQSSLSKARSAFKKGNTEEAIKIMTVAVERFKKVKSIYYNFEGD
ncbi:hypothetical protein [methanotrophic endosymbiont of Bathymodiolus puteoserpentis (Logatchev)]|jgi:hypothetical protein|uniref:hypothetical protein n=1 Tax=methanotrophic endosymbiont of Bathymodiolus puteoserpentis (Logatchev) TaxID=343235 RepID=UPI0013C99A3A|nr:hypothetical protein [methanotrophic endosymbiont of Bathymodiolus puteoserpentis (Logatchev)]SHE22265.1 hypothetical protein BPUTEOMOX_2953 [methanotrophic endosymbiont of Bathymodiolus puteoserpentis (Logatchev)]